MAKKNGASNGNGNGHSGPTDIAKTVPIAVAETQPAEIAERDKNRGVASKADFWYRDGQAGGPTDMGAKLFEATYEGLDWTQRCDLSEDQIAAMFEILVMDEAVENSVNDFEQDLQFFALLTNSKDGTNKRMYAAVQVAASERAFNMLKHLGQMMPFMDRFKGDMNQKA